MEWKYVKRGYSEKTMVKIKGHIICNTKAKNLLEI